MNYGINLELILSDAENICFKENSFDNPLAMKVFKFLEPFKFLKEAKRVLKNGGRVFIFYEVRDSFIFRLGERLGLYIPRREKHYYIVSKMINDVGFKAIRVIPIANILLGVYLFMWYLFFPNIAMRRLLSLLNKNPAFIKLVTKLDQRMPSRFLVLFVGSKY